MTSHNPLRSLVLAPLAIVLAGPALAGRPLSVDDAGTSAGGEGHVEVWMTRADRRVTAVEGGLTLATF